MNKNNCPKTIDKTFKRCKPADPFEKYKVWKKRGLINKKQYEVVLMAHDAGFTVDIEVRQIEFPIHSQKTFVVSELCIKKDVGNPVSNKQVKKIRAESFQC